MPIRMSGLVSGLDTESIVGALMEAQRSKQTKIKNKQQKLEWKKEIWSSLNTKLYGFYNTTLSKMKLQSGYNAKKVSTSDATKVKATATSQAANGTYTIKVKSVASSQNVISGKITSADDSEVTMNTKLVDLGSGNSSLLDGTQISITAGDKTTSLNIDSDTTINDFLSACKDAGLNASFDSKQKRLFISSSKSGKENTFSISAGTFSETQKNAINALKASVNYDSFTESQKSTFKAVMNNLQFGTDSDAERIVDATTKLLELDESSAKEKAKNYYSDSIKKGYTDTYINNDKATDAGKQALIDSGVDESELSGLSDTEMVSKINSLISKKVKEDLKSDEYVQKIDDAVANGLKDASNNEILKSAIDRENEIKNAISTYESVMDVVAPSGNNPLSVLGMSEVDGSQIKESESATGMVVNAAGSSEVEYNGVTIESETTDVSLGGVTASLLGTTGNDTITITVTNDTDGIYDSIKEFITEYNSILSEMNTKYNAASAKDYDVLTDDEKKAMSDDEVEKWNDKIKSSLLRRDSTLDGVRSTFRTGVMGSVTASNGKKYSLANLGITTSTDYKEYGLLHIKGDEDDSVYADSENTLKKMIEEDPDTVREVMTGLLSNLYNELGKKMGSTSLSSALTFYNDKEMNKQIEAYKKEVKNWETKLTAMENRYYSQFTAMEKAMANMQSQQNSLSSMMGGS